MNGRFAYVIDNGNDTIYDLSEKGEILENFLEIQDMLNELDDENIRLKKQVEYLKKVIRLNEPRVFSKAVFEDLEKIN